MISNSLTDHPTSLSYGTLHPDYCWELYCPSTTRRCLIAREQWSCDANSQRVLQFRGVVTPRPNEYSNFVRASSLLRQVAMAAAMVTSVPCKSDPPPERRRGMQGRAPRRRPAFSEAALPPAKRSRCAKRQ